MFQEEVMETKWWNNNSGVGWIPLTLTQLGNVSYTDLKACLITRGFEREVIDFLNSFEPHTVVKEVWDTLMLCEINTQIPGPQEEIERLF